MPPKLYGPITSPPARAVMICAKAIGLDLDIVDVNLTKNEQMKTEFLKLNPMHTVPVLDDNGFILLDSHAIMAYLIDSYAKDKSLYLTDVKERARINQILHFDSGTLFPRHLRTGLSVLSDGAKVVSKENKDALNEAFGFTELFLKNSKFIAGDKLSIADISVFTTISNATVLVPLDEDKYPKVIAWQKTLEAIPYFSINKSGRESYESKINDALAK